MARFGPEPDVLGPIFSTLRGIGFRIACAVSIVTGSGSPEDQEIEQSILRYLSENPEAKDTLEGIAEWWLLREWAARKLPAVERVLRDLVARGVIAENRIG